MVTGSPGLFRWGDNRYTGAPPREPYVIVFDAI
jgi:hypothetical protein